MSNTEFEGKILNIKPEALAKKIIAAGGVLKGSYHFRRYVFDTIPARKGVWVRLRTNGDSTTLTVKEIHDDSVSGTEEWEVTVSDFDETFRILQKSGLKPKGYQENTREEYVLNDIAIALDTWPMIPPYMEIEAQDEATVHATAELLGYPVSELTGENTDKIYQKYDIDITKIPELKF